MTPPPATPIDPEALRLSVDGLRYTLDQPPSPGGGKVVIAVQLDSETQDTPLRDRVDLYLFKARQAFAGLVADLFARQRRETIGHLALLLDQVERAREAHQRRSPDPTATLTDTRREAALALLRDPHLLDLAAETMTTLGYVGEEQTKRLAFLVAVSRLLDRPLSAIVLAPSGAGKSELLEVVAQLVPPEAVEYLSRISPAALYYAGPDHLRHKLVLVDEQAGSADADYAVRTLQSKGFLRLALPIKGQTQHFEARGPIALMSGTTSSTINPENLSRCLRLVLDDSREQTRRIQAAQRAAWTGQTTPDPDLTPWRDAQRLLEPLQVAIPYAEQLSFPARSTHDRRGNPQLLGLVAAHALLHQRQRDQDDAGRLVATVNDYSAVHTLLAPEIARELDGLSPRATRAYRLLARKPTPDAEPSAPSPDAGLGGTGWTRRELGDHLGWGYNTAKRALTDLLAHELVVEADKGPPTRYRVLDTRALVYPDELVPPAHLVLELAPNPQRQGTKTGSRTRGRRGS